MGEEPEQTLKIVQAMDKEDDSIRILQCEGYLNNETYGYAKDILARLFRGNIYRVIFDLQEVKYISSSGWAVFLGPIEVARVQGGDIKLAAMTQEVKFVFEALELNNIIETYAAVEDAVYAFKKK
jgi:anti-sigma B factor antagonist